jgi:signal transduction histidine kinase
VFLCAVVPASVMGLAGLVMRADGELLQPLLFGLGAPYAFALFTSSHRALVEGFEMEQRNEALLHVLEDRQCELTDTNARLEESAAQQATLLDERAALLSTVGHDLGSPLGAAMLTAEILAERPDAISPDMQRELAGRIKAQVHDALTVLRDLTASQRLERAAPEVHRLEVDLEAMVDVVAARHRDQGHGILNAVPEALPVWADPGLLDRMLDNLVANAVKYTPPSSTIEIGADPEGCGPGGVALWVDDDGPGLPLELRDAVFDEFVRGPSATSGTGVGLHLVRTFAQSHGGDVSWQPSERGGSRFVVRLPGRPVEARSRPDDSLQGQHP